MKKSYNSKLAVLAVLLILLVSGIIIYTALLFNEFRLIDLVILVIMLMGLVGVIIQLSAISKRALQTNSLDLKSGTYEYVAEWSVSKSTWSEFNRLITNYELNETKSYGAIIGVFALVVTAIISFPNAYWVNAIYISFGTGLVIGIVAYFSIRASIRLNLKKSSNIHEPSIKFTHQVFFINDTMVQFDGNGVYLRGYAIKELNGMPYVYLSVSYGHATGHKGIKHFTFPFGETGREQFQKIEPLLKSLSVLKKV